MMQCEIYSKMNWFTVFMLKYLKNISIWTVLFKFWHSLGSAGSVYSSQTSREQNLLPRSHLVQRRSGGSVRSSSCPLWRSRRSGSGDHVIRGWSTVEEGGLGWPQPCLQNILQDLDHLWTNSLCSDRDWDSGGHDDDTKYLNWHAYLRLMLLTLRHWAMVW